jgi:hypothetical protein
MTHLTIVNRDIHVILTCFALCVRAFAGLWCSSMIAASIRRFGFNNPVLIDNEDMVIAGHGRLEAAKLLGSATVPAVRLDHLSRGQKAAFVLADNKLAELAGWDLEILAIELQNLFDTDLDFDVSEIGFETTEVDLLLAGDELAEPDPGDIVPPIAPAPPIARVGDLWLLGRHRLFCADATLAASYVVGRVSEDELYSLRPHEHLSVPIDGHVSGLGKAHHPEFHAHKVY